MLGGCGCLLDSWRRETGPLGLRSIQVDEEHVRGRMWRTHSCVPCSHSCEHKLDRTKASVPMSGDAARTRVRAPRSFNGAKRDSLVFVLEIDSFTNSSLRSLTVAARKQFPFQGQRRRAMNSASHNIVRKCQYKAVTVARLCWRRKSNSTDSGHIAARKSREQSAAMPPSR
jgi:hypothetical protein